MRESQSVIRKLCIPVTALAAASAAAAQNTGQEYEEHVIDEIVVEGAALDRTVEQLAQPTGIVGGDALAKKQAASLGETISHELGVSSSYFGPVASRPVIRGQFGERVRVLTNSLDALDASALSEDHAVSVDSIVAERIEIVRGPATLLYGSGAAGGLVNVIDNRIVHQRLDAPFSGALALGSDSATGRENGAAQIAFGSAGIAMHLDYFRRDTDNVEIPGFAASPLQRAIEQQDGGDTADEDFAVVPNTDSTTEGGAAAATFTGDDGYAGISVSRYLSNYGVPGHSEEEAAGAPFPAEQEFVRVDLDQTRFDLKGEYNFSESSSVRFRLGRNNYQHVELEGTEIGTVFDTQGLDTRLEWRHGPLGPLDGAFGVQFKSIDFGAIGEEAFVPGSTTEQTSLFAFEEWVLNEAFVLQGSARLESQRIDTALFPTYDETAFGASIGAIWSLADDHDIAVNFSVTERHPNSTELFANGVHVAVSRVERGSVVLGDGELRKETSANLDITARGENERLEWSITLFRNDIDDYILLSPTPAAEEGFQVFEYTQTDAQLFGFEAEARIELLETAAGGHLHTRLFADLVRGEDRQTGFDLPRIPPLRYGVGLHYTIDQFEASVEARIHDVQRRNAPNELPTDSYNLFNAELSYAFADPDLLLFLKGTNLADKDARQHTSPLKETLPLPGRSVQLGVRYDF